MVERDGRNPPMTYAPRSTGVAGENARTHSPLKAKIALDKVAVGQSCGGFLSITLGTGRAK
jgi:hypothetical protein